MNAKQANFPIASSAHFAALVTAVGALDLGPIMWKVVADPEGPQWDRAFAEKTEADYRRFLILCAAYPDRMIVPSKNVDQFWHAHILDTIKYAEDCQASIGFFLHHFPYFGARGAEDRAALETEFESTQALWTHHFGAMDAGDATTCFKVPSSDAAALCIKTQKVAERPALCGPGNCDPQMVGERPRLKAA
ncbi:MAG: hypothetical protein JWM46_195 [Candidatus Kaiserbacteria bacterium]|nr:hypothetical protein [Candidatus Kaiserbacteria bacterium]